MKFKLIDILSHHEDDVQFGTCELCFHTGSLDTETMVLEDENGKIYELELGYWSWGDYFHELEIMELSIMTIEEWISQHDFQDEWDLLDRLRDWAQDHDN